MASPRKFLRAGLIGHLVGHSKSPIIHNHWIESHGMDGLYEAIDTPPEKLSQTIQFLAERGYAGFNITIPHKQAIMALCDHVEDEARSIGAVNTVKIVDGQLHGYSTDSFGFIASLRQSLPAFDFAAGRAIVLGAGGAARAIVHGLVQAGASEIILCNRTYDSAAALCAAYKNVLPERWEARAKSLRGANLLVNTTALGMKGQEALEIDLSALPEEAAVCDIVYAPLMTELLNAAKARGNPVVTGIGMLLHQAAGAFEIWTGLRPVVDVALEKKVLGA